ncbi:MAG: hypothetical protein ACXIUM_02825 [Wenzhouxiangella sp.]
MPELTHDPRSAARTGGRRHLVALGLALGLLIVVLVGFGPTFFFRAWAPQPPGMEGDLPWSLRIHGSLLTAWFVLLIVQSGLIRAGRHQRHRQLGWIGAGLLVLIVASSLWVMRGFAPRIASLGMDVTPMLPMLSALYWIDTFSLILMIGLVGTALIWRRSSQIHWRLMLTASILMTVPALGRMSGQAWLVGSGWPDLPVTMALLLGLLLILPVHDLLRHRRIHTATWTSGLVTFGSMITALMIAGTEFGLQLAWSGLGAGAVR